VDENAVASSREGEDDRRISFTIRDGRRKRRRSEQPRVMR
jgi:hypothetical protein